jgi:hypothetical protein
MILLKSVTLLIVHMKKLSKNNYATKDLFSNCLLLALVCQKIQCTISEELFYSIDRQLHLQFLQVSL